MTLPLKSSFPPVTAPTTRVLVLGSLPGEASLRQQRYYGHPQNQFWRLMEAVTGVGLVAADYEARLAGLLSAGVGLWDVIREARRPGSLDGAIRDHSANDLRALIAGLPNLRAVAFNGGKAAAIGRPLLGPLPALAVLSLPSSSPAYTKPFETKLAAWRALGAHLGRS